MSENEKFSISSDYAILDAGNTQFYFGYERTVCKCGVDAPQCECENKPWCFTVDVGGVEVYRKKQSSLGLKDGLEMQDYLLQGISMYLTKDGL